MPKARTSEGMVLLKIHAAGFNRRDEWSMIGAYPGLTFPSTMGCDGVGTIEGDSSGQLYLIVPTRGWESDPDGPEAELPGAKPEVVNNKLGGKGFGILGQTKPTGGQGTFAEYIEVEQDQLVKVPSHLSAVQAAALPCGGVTAYRATFTKGKVSKGQNVLITGIGGGVALLALRLCLAAGANVFVTGGSQEKVDKAISFGAKGGAIYKDDKWPNTIRSALPQDRPYLDAVIDSAGGPITAQSAKAGLRNGGRIVCFGMTAVPKIDVTMREVLKNNELLGSTMGSAKEFRECIAFIEKHKIVPDIDTVIDGLDNALDGFGLLADAEKRSGGKVIIKIVDGADQVKDGASTARL